MTIILDGSAGEGGGQILRSALSLSLLTGQPFVIENVRAKRAKPGLLRQHLTAVQAAARISDASVSGDALGSTTLRFFPGKVKAGEYRFAISTAGSAMLVAQTVLPPLMAADGPSRVRVEGGTHNPMAPPFEFFEQTFLPILRRMGARVNATLERWGFYPAGGGAVVIEIEPGGPLRPIELIEPPQMTSRRARAVVAGIPRAVCERELACLRSSLGYDRDACEIVELPAEYGPGNLVSVSLGVGTHTEIFTAFGERGRRSEQVADEVVDQVRDYLAAKQPVGEHLADQLLLPLVMAGGGTFRTGPISRHTLTNIDVIRRFVPLTIEAREHAPRAWTVEVRR
jgi:RNA 3'-terminal phosphate cyclase (ATP)